MQDENKFKFEDPEKGGDGRMLREESIKLLNSIFRERGLSHEDAEEAALDTALIIWKDADKYSESKGKFDSWVYGYVRNITYRYFRKKYRYERLQSRLNEKNESSDQCVETDESNENAESANALLAKYGTRLKDRDIQALNARFLANSGIRSNEVATNLGMTKGAFAQLVYLAMKSLRGMIIAHGKERGCLTQLTLREKAILQMKTSPQPFTEEPLITEIEREVEALKAMDKDQHNNLYLRTLKLVFLCLNSD